MKKYNRILSMGAGVQTTALLLIDQKFDAVIFANPGSEKPETYEYINKYLKPFCKQHDIPWVEVHNTKYNSLESWCKERRYPPDVIHRVCTTEFKVRPIQIWERKMGWTRKNPVTLVLGISYDEGHRANYSQRTQYERREFPLIDKKITREQCYKIIKEKGWELPKKSGCDFCPFAKKSEWREMAHDRPERFEELIQIENTFKNGMVWSRAKKPLRKLAQTSNLDEYIEESCDSGHCFV